MPLHKGSSVCLHIPDAALVFILQALSWAPFLARKLPWFPSKLSPHTNQYYKTLRVFPLKIHYVYYGLSLSSWTECRLPLGRNWASFTPVSLGPAHSRHGSLRCEWKWTDLCSRAHSGLAHSQSDSGLAHSQSQERCGDSFIVLLKSWTQYWEGLKDHLLQSAHPMEWWLNNLYNIRTKCHLCVTLWWQRATTYFSRPFQVWVWMCVRRSILYWV